MKTFKKKLKIYNFTAAAFRQQLPEQEQGGKVQVVRTDHNDQLSEWPEQPERFDQQGERVESRDQPQKVRQPRRMRRNSFAGLFVFLVFF